MSTTTNTLAVRTWNGVEIPAPGTYELDQSHTRVGFLAKHLVVTKVRGNFTKFSGTVSIAEEPLQSRVDVVIETASVQTGAAGRDEHLRSGDFFLAETYPTMEFHSTAVKEFSGGSFILVGDLTIRGVTKQVELAVEFDGVIRNPWGKEVAAFSASTDVDREDWGLSWNQSLEAGGVLVSKKVRIEIEAQAIRQD
jgi:polyisoprenoid-binding protein YceI